MNRTLCLMLLLGALPAAARHLTPEQALERALPATSRSAAVYDFAGKRGPMYVFTDSDCGSTMITPSDSRFRPVLARFDGGLTDGDGTVPPAMEWWLSQYEAEISAAMSRGESSTGTSVVDNYASWTPVKPIVKSKWNQLDPYNKRCPSGTVTGCVATAMAQVIYTNRYARCKGGVHSYVWNDRTLSYDFDVAEFDFDAMTDTYDSSSSAEARNAVAELMYACGVSVDMQYGGESSTGTEKIAPALVSYFGYAPGYTVGLWRPMFNTADWEAQIYHELVNGRGVIYGGSTTTGGGHAFVVDGYSDNGLFHINWGWSGSRDGYFALSVLNPYDQSLAGLAGGFTYAQYAVFAVAPGASSPQSIDLPDPEEDADLSGCHVINFSTGNGLYIDSEARVSFTIVNTGDVDYNDFICLGLYSTDDTELSYADHRNTVIAPGDAASVSINIRIEADKDAKLEPGEYVMKVLNSKRQVVDEFPVEVREGAPSGLWQPGSLQFYVANAADFDGGVVMSGREWTHIPEINCYDTQNVNLALTFYERGTDKVVATVAAVNKQFSWLFDHKYNWPDGKPKVSLPWGVYDMCYTNGGTQCSARIAVRVGAASGSVNYVPSVDDPTKVGVAPGSYRRQLVIPSKVTVDGTECEVTSIEEGAFACTSITALDLPETVASVGMQALRYTNSLRSVIIRSVEPPFSHEALFTFGMRYDAAVYVPAASYDAYAPRFMTHSLYALTDSWSAPEGDVTVAAGEEAEAVIGVTPATPHVNPSCTIKVEPEGIVETVPATVDADGRLVVGLKGIANGKATVTLTPDQPGLEPLSFTVSVTDDSSIDEIGASALGSPTRIYDLQGRRLAAPVRGLNIIDGRKVLIR